MPDSLTLYRTTIGMILNTRFHFYDFRCLITFTWRLWGPTVGGKFSLEQMGHPPCRRGEGCQSATAVCALVDEFENRARSNLSPAGQPSLWPGAASDLPCSGQPQLVR